MSQISNDDGTPKFSLAELQRQGYTCTFKGADGQPVTLSEEDFSSMVHTTTCTTVESNGKEMTQHVGVTAAGLAWLDDGTFTLTVPVSPDMMRDYVPSLQFTATGPDGKPFALSKADCMRMVKGATWTHNGKVIAEYEGSKKRLRALLGKKKNARTKGAHKGGEEFGRGF